MKTDHEALQDALDLLKGGENWTQGSYREDYKGTTSYCAIGALGTSLRKELRDAVLLTSSADRNSDRMQYLELVSLLCDTVAEVTNGKLTDIITFNDLDTTTFTDVEQVFEKAIAKAQELA